MQAAVRFVLLSCLPIGAWPGGRGRVKTLDDVREALTTTVGNPVRFGFVNARLILRTGIDLTQIGPSQRADPVAVRKAIEVLADMGFELSGGARGEER